MVVLSFLVIFLLSTVRAYTCEVSDFMECAKNSTWGFSPPISKTIDTFCRSYRNDVGGCLARRMKVDLDIHGSAFQRGEILLNCTSRRSLQESDETNLALWNARFFFLACVYNDIADVHEQPCFDYLMRNCTQDSPAVECFYGDCPPSRRSNDSLVSEWSYNVLTPNTGEGQKGSSGGLSFSTFITLVVLYRTLIWE